MTSRERLRKALNHQVPDRVPIDLGSTFVTGINFQAYRKLQKFFGVPETSPRIIEPMQMLSCIEPEVMKLFNCDVVGLNPLFNCFGSRNLHYRDWDYAPGIQCGVPEDLNFHRNWNRNWAFYPAGTDHEPSALMPHGQAYFDLIYRQEKIDIDELTPSDAAAHYSSQFAKYSDEELLYYESQAEYLYNHTDYGIIANLNILALGGYINMAAPWLKKVRGVRSPELWFQTMLLNPEYVQELFSRQTETALQNLKMLKEAVGDKIDAIFVSGTDFGTQKSLMISQEVFSTLFKPYYAQVNDWIHANTQWKTFYHSCGAVYNLIDDFVEMGVDILNPVQISAEGMSPKRLKEQYGDKLVFWGGGIDTQYTLPSGTPEEVMSEVRKNTAILGKNGGFVFTPVHNVQADVPPENLAAAYRAASSCEGV